ncbi:hypothetical protein [Brachybacterium sp. UMB0905]|uniref:hypothetical protein n=1 Tax=Brachybacterium sp. UMB0905 TaxID=2069310 RepID=UPI000C8102A4|nr:hypothetical protein [Brachybacterium sp. UMB0905]PMC76600.1 hypothetical protein CJ197_02360 [Brachybacterium sp. UMB0905]
MDRDRRWEVDISASTTAISRPLQLLAPIGADSQEPVSFPLFILRDFEFLRLNGTEFHVVVDSQSIELAPFPVPLPMQGQRRSFSKYSEHADLMVVFPAGIDQLPRIAIAEGTDVHREGPTT